MEKILQLRHKCIGCNACVEAVQAHWVISKNHGKAFLKKSILKGKFYIVEVEYWERDENQKVADNCLVKIIAVN